MNTKTGEIRFFEQNEPLPDSDWIPLRKLAEPNCPICKGKGSRLIKEKGRNGEFKYEPCTCTQ